jgi:hypothetical protein
MLAETKQNAGMMPAFLFSLLPLWEKVARSAG